jgi:tetratricopeptide (TPR) repeat protein
MPNDSIVKLRLPHAGLTPEDRSFFGIEAEKKILPEWPDRCAFSGDEAQQTLFIVAQKKRSTLHFPVPVSEAAFQLAGKNFSWIHNLGLWISYAGVIAFFVVLYFTFSLTSSESTDKNLLFYLGLCCAAISFFGFYLVKILQHSWKEFGDWSRLPGVMSKIVQIRPYFTDVAFSFLNPAYGNEFSALNSHLNKDRIMQTINSNLSQSEGEKEESEAALFDYALACERAGLNEKAVDLYQQIIDQNPDRMDTQKHLGANQLWLRRLNLAEHALERYIKANTDDAEGFLLMASVFEQRGKYSQAREAFSKAMNLSDDPHIRERAGDLAFYSKDYAEAARLYTEASHNHQITNQLAAKLMRAATMSGKQSTLENAAKLVEQAAPEFAAMYCIGNTSEETKKNLQSKG